MVAIAVACLIASVCCVVSCVVMNKHNDKVLKEWKETIDLCHGIQDLNTRLINSNDQLSTMNRRISEQNDRILIDLGGMKIYINELEAKIKEKENA